MRQHVKRIVLTGIGLVALALGLVGLFLPVLPTVPFLLVALWAFSRSSERLHRWLITHPHLGPPLIAWQRHGAISRRSKILAVVAMTGSAIWLLFFADVNPWARLAALVAIAYGLWFVLSRPTLQPALPMHRGEERKR